MKWHKYPEEKPEKVGKYLVTLDFELKDELRSVHIIRYRDGFEFGDRFVVAWAETPAPWEGERKCQLILT